MPRFDHLLNAPYLRSHWKFHFFQWALYLPIFITPFVLNFWPEKIPGQKNVWIGGSKEDILPWLEEFCTVLCENYGVWRWSILSRFWRILGALVFGMWF